MISVEGLTVEFGGTTLFKDISFQINEKDRIALMGKNGAGKSTMLKILAGVRPPRVRLPSFSSSAPSAETSRKTLVFSFPT